jgi:hypothetical protein
MTRTPCTQVDLCAFAERGIFLCLEGYGNNIIVPFEQSPHFTLIWGHIGPLLMVCALIKIGTEESAPHPYHCQLLQSSETICLMQSKKGWTNEGLTTAFLRMQYAGHALSLARLAPASPPLPTSICTVPAFGPPS